MGVASSGKSVVGKAIARRLHAPFLDGDGFHPPANKEKMRAGIPLVDEDRSVAPPYRTLRPEKVHEFEAMQLARAGAPSRAAH